MIFHRRCLKITAKDSPNVIEGLGQQTRKEPQTGITIIQGVLGWFEYLGRLATFTKQEKCESLDAEWYAGPELKLVTPEWFEHAYSYAALRPLPKGTIKYLGIDPAEGGDDTAWVVIDKHGVLQIVSIKTSDTNIIFGKTIELMKQWDILDVNVCFDRAVGKAQADRLRAAGFPGVRTVDFGVIKAEPKRGIRTFPDKREIVETKGEFKSRRSEMYWEIREVLSRPLTFSEDPEVQAAIESVARTQGRAEKPSFALPKNMCTELVREIACVPLKYDDLGKFKLIPKQDEKDDPDKPENQETFRYLLGRSPDQADAFALAIFAWKNKPNSQTAGPT